MARVIKTKSRNPVQTKAKILAAAQKAFSERGYSQTGLRDVARIAGVASSLVINYFGTKAALFEAALIESLRLDGMFASQRSKFGQALIAHISDPSATIIVPELIAVSIGDDEARSISERVVREYIIEPLAAWLGPPRAHSRAENINSLATGYVIFARHIAASVPKDVRAESADWVARRLQEIVDET